MKTIVRISSYFLVLFWLTSSYSWAGEYDNTRLILNSSFELKKQGKLDEAISNYNSVIDQYKATDSQEAQELVLYAYALKASTLDTLNNIQEKMVCLNEIIKRYEGFDDPSFQSVVADAFVMKGSQLGMDGKHDEAIASFNRVINKHSASNNSRLLEKLASAYIGRSFVFREQKNFNEEILGYDSVISLVEHHKTSATPILVRWGNIATDNKNTAISKYK